MVFSLCWFSVVFLMLVIFVECELFLLGCVILGSRGVMLCLVFICVFIECSERLLLCFIFGL